MLTAVTRQNVVTMEDKIYIHVKNNCVSYRTLNNILKELENNPSDTKHKNNSMRSSANNE